jgi:hypothetical protein
MSGGLLGDATRWRSLVALVVLGLGRSAIARPDLLPAAPRTANPTGLAPTAVLGSPDTLADLVKIFRLGEVSQGGGRRLLGLRLGELLKGIAGDSSGREVQVAFIVDRSQKSNLGSELQLALAANRERLARGRFALIACGVRESAWSADVVAPFSTDAYEVLRAAGRINWQPGGGGIGASVAGLAAAARLDWHLKQGRPHVVLLTDEPLPGEIVLDRPAPSAADGEMLASVRAWAGASQAALHGILGMFHLHDGREHDASEDSLEQRSTVTLAQIAGLFRQGRYEKVTSEGEFTSAVEHALAQSTSERAGADVAMVVDATGLMGANAGALRAQQGLLGRFVSVRGGSPLLG